MDPDRTPAIARGAHAGVASRVSEMEQLLEAFERARAAARVERRPRPFDGDPVALTQALHPRELRQSRRSRNEAPRRDQGGMRLRIVVYDGTTRT
jgi:hypothetical protein